MGTRSKWGIPAPLASLDEAATSRGQHDPTEWGAAKSTKVILAPFLPPLLRALRHYLPDGANQQRTMPLT
jgi:hypothetical protein